MRINDAVLVSITSSTDCPYTFDRTYHQRQVIKRVEAVTAAGEALIDGKLYTDVKTVGTFTKHWFSGWTFVGQDLTN